MVAKIAMDVHFFFARTSRRMRTSAIKNARTIVRALNRRRVEMSQGVATHLWFEVGTLEHVFSVGHVRMIVTQRKH